MRVFINTYTRSKLCTREFLFLYTQVVCMSVCVCERVCVYECMCVCVRECV